MFTVLACMAAGMFVGLKFFPDKYQKMNGLLQYIFIAILIFCMGAALGGNPAFFDDLKSVGLKSLLFAVIPIVCSVAAVYFITKRVFKE